MASIYNDYSKLSTYLDGQQFGPKSAVPVPDMAYPILPESRVNYGYSALTHDSTPYTGYYSIDSGYGKKEACGPVFMYGACPSNAFVRPYIQPPTPPTPPTPTPPKPSNEGFQLKQRNNVVVAPPSVDVKPQLKDLKLVMFTQDGCKYCSDVMKDLNLKKNCPSMEILNLKDKRNVQLFQGYGGQGVPFFVSKATNKSFTGHPRTVTTLVDALSNGVPPPQPRDIQSVMKQLNIKLLLSKQCGYSKRLKNMLEQNGVSDTVVMYWDNDPSAQDVFGSLAIDGVPVIYSVTTGKHVVGAPPTLHQLIDSLNI